MENLKFLPGAAHIEAGRREMADFLKGKPVPRVIWGRLQDLSWSLRSFAEDVAPDMPPHLLELAKEMLLASGALTALLEGTVEDQGWQLQAHATAWVSVQLIHTRATLWPQQVGTIFSYLEMEQEGLLAGWLAEQERLEVGARFALWVVVQRLIMEAEHLEDGEIEGSIHALLNGFEAPISRSDESAALLLN